MKNFGKYKSTPTRVEITREIEGLDEDGEPILGPRRFATANFMRDASGRDLCDIAVTDPHKFYLAVTDAGHILSMTDDIEQSQIEGVDIIGIDEDFGFSFGPGGSVYGCFWDGKKIVEPEVIPTLDKWKIEAAFLSEGIDPETLLAPRERALWRSLTEVAKENEVLTAIKAAANMSVKKFNSLWSKARETN